MLHNIFATLERAKLETVGHLTYLMTHECRPC